MLRRLIKNSKDYNFVVIYTREPHARQMAFTEVEQPITWEERCALAQKSKKELKLDALFLIDEMGDPSRKLFGDLPNPAIFVEMDGTIKEKLVWADGYELRQFIKDWKPTKPKTLDEKPEVEAAGDKARKPGESETPSPSTEPKTSTEPRVPAEPKVDPAPAIEPNPEVKQKAKSGSGQGESER